MSDLSLIEEARSLIWYIGTTGAERTDVIRRAELWLQRFDALPSDRDRHVQAAMWAIAAERIQRLEDSRLGLEARIERLERRFDDPRDRPS